MTKKEAEIIAQQVLDSQWKGRAIVKVVPEQTIEKEYGWIFFSRVEEIFSGTSVLLGNLPVLIKKTGEVVRIPSQIGLEEAIRRYEAGLPFFAKRKAENQTNS
jgi:hypothetical protein